jgi:hypothetical protein
MGDIIITSGDLFRLPASNKMSHYVISLIEHIFINTVLFTNWVQ